MKTYWAKTEKGGFEVKASTVSEAWEKAKIEAEEINAARREIGWGMQNIVCKIIKILKQKP